MIQFCDENVFDKVKGKETSNKAEKRELSNMFMSPYCHLFLSYIIHRMLVTY